MPGRRWNVYVRPPSVGVGSVSARSGTSRKTGGAAGVVEGDQGVIDHAIELRGLGSEEESPDRSIDTARRRHAGAFRRDGSRRSPAHRPTARRRWPARSVDHRRRGWSSPCLVGGRSARGCRSTGWPPTRSSASEVIAAGPLPTGIVARTSRRRGSILEIVESSRFATHRSPAANASELGPVPTFTRPTIRRELGSSDRTVARS